MEVVAYASKPSTREAETAMSMRSAWVTRNYPLSGKKKAQVITYLFRTKSLFCFSVSSKIQANHDNFSNFKKVSDQYTNKTEVPVVV